MAARSTPAFRASRLISGEATGSRPFAAIAGTPLALIAAVPAAGERGAGMVADDRVAR